MASATKKETTTTAKAEQGELALATIEKKSLEVAPIPERSFVRPTLRDDEGICDNVDLQIPIYKIDKDGGKITSEFYGDMAVDEINFSIIGKSDQRILFKDWSEFKKEKSANPSARCWLCRSMDSRRGEISDSLPDDGIETLQREGAGKLCAGCWYKEWEDAMGEKKEKPECSYQIAFFGFDWTKMSPFMIRFGRTRLKAVTRLLNQLFNKATAINVSKKDLRINMKTIKEEFTNGTAFIPIFDVRDEPATRDEADMIQRFGDAYRSAYQEELAREPELHEVEYGDNAIEDEERPIDPVTGEVLDNDMS